MPRLAIVADDFHLPRQALFREVDKGFMPVACGSVGDVEFSCLVQQVNRRASIRGKMGTERDRDRFVLGSDDVLLEQYSIEIGRICLEPGSILAFGLEPAHRVAEFVDARAWVAQLMTKRAPTVVQIACPQQLSHLAEFARRLQALIVWMVGTDGFDPSASLDILDWLLRIRFAQHDLCGGDVFLDVRCGEGKHGANPFESIPLRVFKQAARIRCVVVHADQVAHGVDVFFASQAIVGDAVALRHACRFALFDPRRDPLDDALAWGGLFRPPEAFRRS